MSANGWLQFAIYSLILLATVRPVGIYLARVLEGERTWLDPVLRPIERLIYKLCGVNADKEMNWREYAFAMLGFSAVSMLLTYGIERLQALLPWNPQHLAAVGPDLAWNTAASFTTNTNWQFYTPETTMSYLTEMAGLATHNFWSAAVGIVVAVALIRGIKRTTSGTIGNFWVDMTRTLLYVLLPASLIYALLLVAQGVPQNLHAYTAAHPLEQPSQTQTIGAGPGGLAGSHQDAGHQRRRILQRQQRPSLREPHAVLELSPDPLHLHHSRRPHLHAGPHDRLAGPRLGCAGGHVCALRRPDSPSVYWAESQPHPLIHGAAADRALLTAPGGNMEGKEVRNGIAESSLFATITTDASCGAVNGMHDSFTPLGGMVAAHQHHAGRGGLRRRRLRLVRHADLRRALGLHRRPHGGPHPRVPGQKDRSLRREDVHALRAHLPAHHSFAHRRLRALANDRPLRLDQPRAARVHRDPLRLYLRRGQQRLGLRRASEHQLVVQRGDGLGHAASAGFFMMIPVLALAGNLAQEEERAAFARNLPVNTPLFTVLLVGVVLILGALTFFPALSLGPILEHLLLKLASFSNRYRTALDETKRTVMAEKKSLWNTEIMGPGADRLGAQARSRAGWSRTR